MLQQCYNNVTTMLQQPCNHGKRWTPEEIKRLLSLHESGSNNETIGHELGRSSHGIFCAIRTEAIRRIRNGSNLDEVSEWSQMTPNYLMSCIKIQNEKRENEFNVGKRWTPEEIKRMMILHESGYNNETIGRELGRSSYGIFCAIRKESRYSDEASTVVTISKKQFDQMKADITILYERFNLIERKLDAILEENYVSSVTPTQASVNLLPADSLKRKATDPPL